MLLMIVGKEKSWAEDLTASYYIYGYESYNKNFYNFRNNSPAVLPISGDLRYRENWGLHNFGSGPRSAVVSIPVAAGDLLVLQQYNDEYQTTINRGDKNDGLSYYTGFQCFNITQDANDITISTPRYGGVVAVLVFSQKYSYSIDASNGTNILKTLTRGLVSVGESVTIAYPQFILSGNTLYNIANNGSGDWFRKTITPYNNQYNETLYYTNGTVQNVVYYQDAEDVAGVLQATNEARASNGKMGYTNNASTYVNTKTLGTGAYKIFLRGVNSNAQTKNVSFKVGDTEVYSLGITQGVDQRGSSGNIQFTDDSMLSFSCEGSSTSGLDWFYIQAVFAYKTTSSTMTCGQVDYRPDMILPDVVENNYTFTSDNPAVATVDWQGIDAHHNGTATITAKRIIDDVEYYTTHTVTVTGEAPATTSFNYNASTKTETYEIMGTGYLPDHDEGTTISIGYGSTSEIQTAEENYAYCIDKGGFWHAHLSNNNTGIPDMGTYYILKPKLGYHGQLSIYAYVSDNYGTRNGIRLVDKNGAVLERITGISSNWATYSFNYELIDGETYYLFAETGSMDNHMNDAYSILFLHSLSFVQSNYNNTSAVIAIPSDGIYEIPNETGLTNPTYNIVNAYGELVSHVTIDGNRLRNITTGGAVKIGLTANGHTAYHLLTVAYRATPYPGKLWDFNIDDENKASLEVHADYWSEGKGFPRIDARQTPAITYEGREYEDATGWSVTDNHGGTWVARNKNINANSGRDARWRYANAVHGDNAFIINETAGLIFNTGAEGFFIRNDRLEKDAPSETPEAYKGQSCWSHVGIRQNGSSFTIPYLNAGDIIEINWKRESGGAGGIFEATNASDLRDIAVTKKFVMTGSQIGTTGGVTDFHKNPGLTSFKATANGDVTFTLRDNGATDILSIRIYRGDYKPTMKTITSRDNHNPEPEMLVDNSYKEYEYNYCNMLNSTNTGPAFYVLKGWRNGTDNEESVTGTDSGRDIQGGNPVFNLHTDPYAYVVNDDKEEARLYDLRKNLIGFRLWNYNWVSSRNAYNDGRVGAQGGWGKVTFRMNNYTNFVDESDGTMGVYLIGYTPDCTLTIGSAPHQTYPYTWDFTKIAGGTVTGEEDNVLYSIEEEGSISAFEDQVPTNWIKENNGQFILNTDNSEEANSQYVPGAVLVTTERALSKYSVPEGVGPVYAKDELDGLGFAGDITMHIDHLPSSETSGWNRKATEDHWYSILSFLITDYATFEKTGGTDEEPIGIWHYSQEVQDAGNGKIQLNHADESNHIDESYIPSGGIGFRLDEGETKYIRVIPGSRLQAGDIISVTAYNAYGNRDAGISFNKSASSSDVAQYKMLSNRLVEETLTYTVTTNDGLDDKEEFYLFRNTNTVHITAIEISRKASAIPNLDWCIYTLSRTSITVPDLNADGKQDWIYVSATKKPRRVVNYDTTGENEIDLSLVTDAAGGGPDANTNVYKYKVSQPGNVHLIFDEETKIYKIGVTHILKEIHPVGNTGWATEIRKHSIDHELIGYFTKNDVNAYTVKYDSYDMKTATVALTPINEDGYVPEKTGIVMRLDNISGLPDANNGKNVPLFYPSYTRPQTSTAVDFPNNNWMYNVEEGIDNDNRNYHESISIGNVDYTKFILTNNYWTFDKDHSLNADEAATAHTADAAGFYRMHIWKTTGDVATKNTMPAHTAYMLVPSDNLPAAVWTLQSGYSAARGNLLGVYNIIGPDSETAIDDIRLTPEAIANGNENDGHETWYSASGMKLSSRPTQPGLYICNGKKVVVRREP